MLALYGHPFSSYTWKALIALYAEAIPFEFRIVDAEHPNHAATVQSAGPQGKFPVLADGERLIFEATSIIEHIARHHAAGRGLVPADADAAIATRTLDRVFDNYVMNVAQIVVDEHIRKPQAPDRTRIEEAGQRLERSYRWLENWLETYFDADKAGDHVTLIECAAAPSLFYADWVHPIADEFPRLKGWRAHLLALPPVARCVDDARPFRSFFPPGAPDRD